MSNLFDDADEQEFQPTSTEQQPASDNPYAQEQQQQPEEQKKDLFGDGDDDEYKPQEVQADANPYQQEEMPMGFGAERANLMGEAAVVMPPTAEHSANGGNEGESQNAMGGSDLSIRANNAKTQLISEILAFNTEKEALEGASEETKDEKEQNAQLFTVKDPVKVGSVTKYTVTGRDNSQGEWTCQRRYNEFETLYKCLVDRWPGCYIPAIPEKTAYTIDVQNMKMQDNKDAEFVEGRRMLLEKFIKELSHFDYLLESKEFQIFARGAGEVTSQLEALEAQRPVEILEKYRLNFAIDEDQANSEMLQYKDKISAFQAFLTRAYTSLEVSCLLDIKAMMTAMSGRSNQEALQTKAEQKQREKKQELEKMTLGKTTLKSFFKSKSTIQKDIDSYSAAIQQLDVDIDQYKKLVNFITIFHGQIGIDKFKRLKSASYYKMLNNFSIKEVSNAHLHATLAHSILEMQDNF